MKEEKIRKRRRGQLGKQELKNNNSTKLRASV
jgi:hypothetical protein